MSRYKKLIVAASMTITVSGVATSTVPAGAAPSSSLSTRDSAVTTVPQTASASSSDYAAIAYAKEKGVSIVVAGQRLNQLTQLTAYADSRRKSLDFSGFRIFGTPGGPEGQLAATSVETNSFDQTRNIRFFPSQVSEREAASLTQTLATTAQISGVADAAAATIDPFNGDVTIWRNPPTPIPIGAMQTDVNTSTVRDALRQVEPRIPGNANVTVQFEPGSSPARGRKKEALSSSFCFYR